MNENLILCLVPVLWLVKLSSLIIMLQVLKRVLQQGLLPVCVSVLTVFSLARTSRSLILCGHLNATMGGSGMATLSLSETWRMFKCFLKVLAIRERAGW